MNLSGVLLGILPLIRCCPSIVWASKFLVHKWVPALMDQWTCIPVIPTGHQPAQLLIAPRLRSAHRSKASVSPQQLVSSCLLWMEHSCPSSLRVDSSTTTRHNLPLGHHGHISHVFLPLCPSLLSCTLSLNFSPLFTSLFPYRTPV